MSLPIQPADGPFHDPGHFTDVFLGAFRRDVLSFYPGARIEREALPPMVASRPQPAHGGPSQAVEFRLLDVDASPSSLRVSLFGVWYRLSVPRPLGLGARDRELLHAVGRVMELHHQVLFRWSGGSLLRLRRGMPEDHYVAACLEPSSYMAPDAAPSRVAEAILTLRTMALSTYENRRVCTGALILGHVQEGVTPSVTSLRARSAETVAFGVELTGLKTLRRLCDGRRTVFLVDHERRLSEIIDIRRWAMKQAAARSDLREGEAPAGAGSAPLLDVPCARAYTYHAMATRTGGHACLVLSPNQEIKVFASGVQAFVFAHGRWRVLDPASKYAGWEDAVGEARLARALFQTALDLAEERQGGLLVVVSDPAQAIGRLIAPHDVLETRWHPGTEGTRDEDEAQAAESPARPFSLFGLDTLPEPISVRPHGPAAKRLVAGLRVDGTEPLTKRSLHYLARGASVTALDASVLEALAGLDGALVTDFEGRLLAFGAILRHDAHSLPDPDDPSPGSTPPPEGARTTAALVASHFGPVLKISEDGIVSCFVGGERVWDL
jgi:hypothetical protein